MRSPALSAWLAVVALCLSLVSCSDEGATQPGSAKPGASTSDASSPGAGEPATPVAAPPVVIVPSVEELRGTIGDKNQFGIVTHACCELDAACCAIPGCCDLSAATGDACKSPKCPRIPQ